MKKTLRLDKRTIPLRPSEIMKHYPYIKQIIESYPKLRAKRILDMLRERGYEGTVYPIRRLKREMVERTEKAYLDLKFQAGEQARLGELR